MKKIIAYEKCANGYWITYEDEKKQFVLEEEFKRLENSIYEENFLRGKIETLSQKCDALSNSLESIGKHLLGAITIPSISSGILYFSVMSIIKGGINNIGFGLIGVIWISMTELFVYLYSHLRYDLFFHPYFYFLRDLLDLQEYRKALSLKKEYSQKYVKVVNQKEQESFNPFSTLKQLVTEVKNEIEQLPMEERKPYQDQLSNIIETEKERLWNEHKTVLALDTKARLIQLSVYLKEVCQNRQQAERFLNYLNDDSSNRIEEKGVELLLQKEKFNQEKYEK